MKKPILIVCMILIFGLLTSCGPQPIKRIGSSKYYVEIQSKGKKYTEQDITRYKYKLKGFNKDGESKKLTFTSNHRLKEDAYLRIYYKKGEVITYEQVKRGDMPKKPKRLLGGGNHS